MGKKTHASHEVNVKRIVYYTWRALMQNKIRTFLILFIIPISALINNIVMPYGTSLIVEQLSMGNFNFQDYLPIIAILVIPIAAQNLIIVRIVDWLDWSLDAKGGKYLSELAFDKIMSQSMSFHNDHFSGSLTSQANKLPQAFISLKSCMIWDVLPLAIGLLVIVITCFTVSPIFAMILLVFILCYFAVSIFTFAKTRHLDAKLPEAENKQTGQLADSITNAISVKAYARESYEHKRFVKSTKDTHDATMLTAKVSMLRNFSMNFVNMVAFTVLLIVVLNGHNLFGLSVASIVFLFSLFNTALDSVWRINPILRQFNRALGNANEMVEILDTPTLVVDTQDATQLSVVSSAIDFHRITFQHQDAKAPIFQDFSLEIAPGERIGLVGVSGSGKTTLTKLLLRFADVSSGEILIDGQDIKHVTQQSLRENIAYVPQETSLFHRSIAENIGYGKLGATNAEIQRAARLANAEEFIKDLPDGYDTLVGERGVKLSGGQRQRIAIARAILKDAPILILDEATSALDSESEALIQDALINLMQNRTSIVIAHRLSTVASLDRIVVMKDGRIVEQGSHQELLKQDGEYAKLWSRQSGAFIK